MTHLIGDTRHHLLSDNYPFASVAYLRRKQRAAIRALNQIRRLQQRFNTAAARYEVKPRWGSVAFFSKATGRPARISTRLSGPFGYTFDRPGALALRDLCADVDEGQIPRADAHDRAVATVLAHWDLEAERMRAEIAVLDIRIAKDGAR